MSDLKVLGIDLAKTIFQLHGMNASGKCVFTRRVKREKLLATTVNLPACLIGMEASLGAHYWAGELIKQGHVVKLMAPQFVKPYVLSHKTDKNDARGIAEAVSRADMKFVPIKNSGQQDIQLLHRARELAVKQRTAQANQIRGLLLEYGLVLNKGIQCLKQLPELLEQAGEQLTTLSKAAFEKLYEQFKVFDETVQHYDKKLAQIAQETSQCQALMEIEGIGPLSATAFVASVGDAKAFKRGREVSAWLGLVPGQHSSGNKVQLTGISKRGDRYLRTLLIHGARSVVNRCDNKTDGKSLWIADKKKRCGHNKAAVALANKQARIMWALLATGECYRHPKAANSSAKVTLPATA